MRVYASKYVGAGIRVGVAQNVRMPRGRGSRVPAPRIVKPLVIAICVAAVVAVAFPPMMLVGSTLLLVLGGVLVRARYAARSAYRAAIADPRPVWGTPARAAYDQRAAAIAALDARAAAERAAYEQRMAQKRLAQRPPV